MENHGAGEGSHLETHSTPKEGSVPVIISGQSSAQTKTTVGAPVRSAREAMTSPGSASKVPTVGAPVRSATEVIGSSESARKVPTAGDPVRSAAETTASPGSASKVQKSVKHLECAYFFGPSPGCKWTEEQCLYSHTPTGSRAQPPVQIEPGSKFEHTWLPYSALVYGIKTNHVAWKMLSAFLAVCGLL